MLVSRLRMTTTRRRAGLGESRDDIGPLPHAAFSCQNRCELWLPPVTIRKLSREQVHKQSTSVGDYLMSRQFIFLALLLLSVCWTSTCEAQLFSAARRGARIKPTTRNNTLDPPPRRIATRVRTRRTRRRNRSCIGSQMAATLSSAKGGITTPSQVKFRPACDNNKCAAMLMPKKCTASRRTRQREFNRQTIGPGWRGKSRPPRSPTHPLDSRRPGVWLMFVLQVAPSRPVVHPLRVLPLSDQPWSVTRYQHWHRAAKASSNELTGNCP